MSIETATPSSAETIAALFDQLVEAVAQRVMAKLQEGDTLDNLVDAVAQRVMAKLTGGDGIALDNVLDAWAMNSTVLEDKVGDQIQSFVDNQLDLDDAVRQALDNIDLDDMVMTAVQELEFNVRVSR